MKRRKVSQQQPQPRPATQLILSDPENLRSVMQDVQIGIARRAYELFEARGLQHGHDWEDWFRAESELLRPVPVFISESAEQVSVRANVLGFHESELKVSVQPSTIVIYGKRETSATQSEGGKLEYIDWYPDQIFRVIALPVAVVPERASIKLQAGLLEFELPRAVQPTVEAQPEVA
jgi:HSP20 family protein